MNLRPGCGCAVLILGVLNLFLAFVAVYGLVARTVDATPLSVSFAVVFFGNCGVCATVGLAAMRRGGARQASSADSEKTGDEGEEVEMESED